MIYPVKVFKADGTLKEVVPSKNLEKDYWKRFKESKYYRNAKAVEYNNKRGKFPIEEE